MAAIASTAAMAPIDTMMYRSRIGISICNLTKKTAEAASPNLRRKRISIWTGAGDADASLPFTDSAGILIEATEYVNEKFTQCVGNGSVGTT